ncbi:hypothetical protein [Cryobacterium soli]|uniref:hypothetical protein n=1 Tax=Cryobacterium soli TaxID=2220095 RepID=UPI0013C5006C|nr:hypothetical protein [Cryobacterium soli]
MAASFLAATATIPIEPDCELLAMCMMYRHEVTGELRITVANVTGASVVLTAAKRAEFLRMAATAVEAEEILTGGSPESLAR